MVFFHVRHVFPRWIPVYADPASQSLGVMSIAFLLQSRAEAVVWRGPKKTALVQQFLRDVCWGDLDFLVVDTPPGTSDEHLALAEFLLTTSGGGAVATMPQVGAVLVTTPQNVALTDVAREITFCTKTRIPMLGVIENMSGFVCPHCAVRKITGKYLLKPGQLTTPFFHRHRSAPTFLVRVAVSGLRLSTTSRTWVSVYFTLVFCFD